MRPVRIATLRYDLPGAPVADAALGAETGMSLSDIQSWSRGRLRHEAPDGEGPADMAARAAAAALESRGIDASGIDLLLFATNTPDYWFPGSACFLQSLLGAPGIACLDVRSQCTGFVIGLDVARRFVATGAYDRVLLAAGEVPSHHNRRDDGAPALTCAMSDAAAVALVEEGEGEGAILAAACATDGRRHQSYWCEAPAGRNVENTGFSRGQRLTSEMIASGAIYPRADLAALREIALAEVPGILRRALDEAQLSEADAAIVAHVDPSTELAIGDANWDCV
jgi:3-oxoacyl-[acyl-carrier-protein] synthase-3